MQTIFCLLLSFCTTTAIHGIDTLPPAWMRNAVIYGIKPSGFVQNATYADITAKLPELKNLGINTIWLQPVFATARGGQGYDITDYFSLRNDLGTRAKLKTLIDSAHLLGIRTLFDFVPNHTSIAHPFAKDVMEKGKASPYYDFYQHENDGAPYSSHYHTDQHGFVYYFWQDLVNLNYNNEAVRKMITDACIYWITELDIDGYRFDAVWAVNARAPQFFNTLRKKMKSVKQDVLLLAEDKGADPKLFSLGFDAGYDWTADSSWVSHWPWQYKHHEKENHTIFNHPDTAQRYSLIRKALFDGNPHPERILRFMENNDLPRFINSHTTEQTKMAAALLFALPGIPLLYNGQETGFTGHPYSKKPIFKARNTIRSQDSLQLFDYYKSLVHTRLKYPAFTSANFSEHKLKDTGSAIAFRRWTDKENFIIMINPYPSSRQVQLDNTGAATLRDILNNRIFKKTKTGFMINMPGYSAKWLLAVNE